MSTTNNTGVLFGAEPIEIAAGPHAVLFCHGFTGSPQSLATWAKYLAQAGYSVSLPRLPGHGTQWQDLLQCSWQSWYETVETAYLRLQEEHEKIFIAGLSMGGALALRLAQKHPEVAGLVLVNPAIASKRVSIAAARFLAPVVTSVTGIASDIAKPGISELGYSRTPVKAVAQMTQLWTAVRSDLHEITQPILCFRSRIDHVVDDTSVDMIMKKTRGNDLLIRMLANSFHVATLDNDADLIFSETHIWLRQHS